MKKFIIILISIFVTHFLQGQNMIKPYQENDKWGFKNKEGKVITKAKYDYAKNLSDGYGVAFVKGEAGSIDAKATVIDSLGNIIIKPKYREIKYIGNNLFEVWQQGKYFGQYKKGILNNKEQVIIPVKYRYITKSNNYFIVKKVTDSVVGHHNGMDKLRSTRKEGVYTLKGKKILPVKYDRIKRLNNNNYAARKDKDYALFSPTLKQLTDFKYIVIGNFFYGFSKVRKGDLYGFINKDGKEEIKCKYQGTSIFLNGYARVLLKGEDKFILIDTTGKEFLPDFKYKDVGYPYKNQIVISKNGKLGIANLMGNILLPTEFNDREMEYHGIAFFKKDDKWQIWDFNKKELLPRKYNQIFLTERKLEDIIAFGRIPDKVNSQSIALVRIGNNWGVVNEKGEIIESFKYKEMELYKKYVVP